VDLFVCTMMLSALTDALTAGRLIQTTPYSRDRSDAQVEAMLSNPWIPRPYKVELLKDLAFDLQEFSADRKVGDEVFTPRLDAFKFGCFILDAREDEVGMKEREFILLTARRARTVRARKRGQYEWFDGLIRFRRNKGGSR